MCKKKIEIMVALLVIAFNCAFPQSNGRVLKGRLLFGRAPAKSVKVILVPRNSANIAITGGHFFYGDDLSQLKRMNAVVALTNNEGYYYFNNIRSGQYILKVCEMYGTVYKFRVTTDQYDLRLIPDLHAVAND